MMIRMITLIKKKYLQSLFLGIGLALAACTNEVLPELSIDSVSIYTDLDANQNSATAVDLVIIYDQELVKLLGQMSAAKYFSSSKQMLLDNPTLLDVWHWELVPGQIVQDFSPPQEKGNAYAAYVFANYLTPGDHRIKVAPTGIVKILLLRNDLKNLAVYDLHDARMGTTMSNSVRTVGGPGTCIPEIKLGPTKNLMTPCKKIGPKFTLEACPPPICARQRPPIPIITRPLRPPPAVAKPCRKKVKQWQK